MKRRAFLGLAGAGLTCGGFSWKYVADERTSALGTRNASERDFEPNAFDYIIVGSGTAGATLARELVRKRRKVLLLERGSYIPLEEGLWTMVSMMNSEVEVAEELEQMNVFAAGGSSAMYMALAEPPPFEAFRSLGIDLNNEYAALQRELPIAVMSDALLSPQTRKLADAAVALGHDWTKNLMSIDQKQCNGGYSYEAKWKALSFVDESVRLGATLRCETEVRRVLIANNKAVGVECSIDGGKTACFFGRKIIVSAGALATPLILQKSGLSNVTAKGYCIDPSFVLLGQVPGLKGRESYTCTMGTTLGDGTKLLDGASTRLFFNILVASLLQPGRMSSYGEHVGIMVKAHDAVSGSLSAEGRYHKTLEPAVLERLRHGEVAARSILHRAGAGEIIKTSLITGATSGTLRIRDEVDERLQTKVSNLHVCDGSLMPENGRVAPGLSLICLAKYLAKVLLDSPVGHARTVSRRALACI